MGNIKLITCIYIQNQDVISTIFYLYLLLGIIINHKILYKTSIGKRVHINSSMINQESLPRLYIVCNMMVAMATHAMQINYSSQTRHCYASHHSLFILYHVYLVLYDILLRNPSTFHYVKFYYIFTHQAVAFNAYATLFVCEYMKYKLFILCITYMLFIEFKHHVNIHKLSLKLCATIHMIIMMFRARFSLLMKIYLQNLIDSRVLICFTLHDCKPAMTGLVACKILDRRMTVSNPANVADVPLMAKRLKMFNDITMLVMGIGIINGIVAYQ